MIKKFENFEEEDNLEPLTIKQLIDKLNMVMEKFDVSENDYIFFTPVGEDEGNTLALTPVHNISAPAIQFHTYDADELGKIKQNRGIDLCFVKPDIKKI
jgi:hypothetical protein